jgi:hypothetical protein
MTNEQDAMSRHKREVSMSIERKHESERPAEGSAAAARWREHEHVAGSVQNEAQKLIDEAGSPALAKKAVDSAARDHAERPASEASASSKDHFARNHGFKSYLDLFEASTTMAQCDGKNWFVTALPGGKWIMWNDRDLDTHRSFDTFEEACAQVPPKGTSVSA